MVVLGLFDSKNHKSTIKELLEQLWEYQEAEANILVEIATLEYEEGDSDDAIGFLEKAIDIYNELGFDEQEALMLDLIGDIYRNNDDISNAIDYYRKSYKLCSKLDNSLKDDVLIKINEIDDELKTTQSADGHKRKGGPLTGSSSLESAPGADDEGEFQPIDEDSVDYVAIGRRLDDIIGFLDESAVYGTYQNYENALFRVKEAYEMAQSIGDTKGEAALLLIMGDMSLKEEKTKKSLEFFIKSLKLFKKIGDKKGESISRLMIGTAYFLLGETDEGSVYLRDSMETIKHLKDDDIETAALALLKSIYGD